MTCHIGRMWINPPYDRADMILILAGINGGIILF